MSSKEDRLWMLFPLLLVLAIVAIAVAVLGESHTWDDEADFEGGDWEATLWDSDEGGITLTGRSTFVKYRGNPVITEGGSGAWDENGVLEPTVVFAKGQYYLYYTGVDSGVPAIGVARSTDGKSFSKYGSSAVISGDSGKFDVSGCREPTVLYEDGLFKMWYTGVNSGVEAIGYATSKDGLSWTKYGSNPVLSQPSATAWGDSVLGDPCVIRVDGMYYMYLTGDITTGSNKLVGIATSSDETSWNLHSSNPIVSNAPSGTFGAYDICDVAVIQDGPVFKMFFTGRKTNSVKYKIGYGESFDGFTWDLSTAIHLDLGWSGTFDEIELNSPCAIMGNEGVIHVYYEGNDATDYEIGLATLKPWLVMPNTPNDKILGKGSEYDATHLMDPCVIQPPGGSYLMYYGCYGGASYPYAIAKASSTVPDHTSTWNKFSSNPVLNRSASGWDDDRLSSPCVIFDLGVYKMWYAGYDGSVWKIGYATSTGGNTWTKYGSNPVLSGTSSTWDADGVTDPWVLKVGNTYHMWYVGWTGGSGNMIGHATSSDGTTWTKDSANPVFVPEPNNDWEEDHVENPSVTWVNGRFVMYYDGRYTTTKQRIGVAYSLDGGNWTRDPSSPVMDWGNSTHFTDEGISIGSVLRVGAYKYVYYAGYSGTNWEIGYATFGAGKATYITPALDASSQWPVAWGTLSWDAEAPMGTTVRFQVATNQGGTIWRFVGPDGTDGTYFTNPGQGIHWFQSGKVLRVRAYMTTDDMERFIPVLRSITVTYGPRNGVSPPQVTVTSPNGGEDWMKTKAYPITWEAQGNLNGTSVSLDYSTDNGTSWTSIATRQQNTGFYKWTVPSVGTSGALIRVTVIDIDGMMAVDTSDATFAIDPPAAKAGAFHVPAAGDVVAPGPLQLSWTVEDPWGLSEAPLTLDLTTDGGLTWSELASGLPFTDGIQWEVPQLSTSSGDCMMRLSVRSWLGDVSVIESGRFTIDVTSPVLEWDDVPKTMVAGKTYTISVIASDDTGLEGVDLHIGSEDGETVHGMEQAGSTWVFTYTADSDDERIWASTSDGVHDVETPARELSIASAPGAPSGASGSLAVELLLAAGLAVVVFVALALAVRRR
jgi:predicted GH43/DUF377 family glycosyl hydrolase